MADLIFNVKQTINPEALTEALQASAEVDGISLVGQPSGAHWFDAEQVIVHAREKLTGVQQMVLLDIIKAHDPRTLTNDQLAQEAEATAKEEAALTLRELVNTLSESVDTWQSLDDVKRDLRAWLPALVERLV